MNLPLPPSARLMLVPTVIARPQESATAYQRVSDAMLISQRLADSVTTIRAEPTTHTLTPAQRGTVWSVVIDVINTPPRTRTRRARQR